MKKRLMQKIIKSKEINKLICFILLLFKKKIALFL